MASRKFKRRERELLDLERQGLKFKSEDHVFWCVMCRETFRSDRVEHAWLHIETAKHRSKKDTFFLQ